MDVHKVILKTISDRTVIAVSTVITVLYVSTIAPQLPPWIKSLFDNGCFKVVFLFACFYLGSAKRPTIALISLVAFLLMMQFVAEAKVIERFSAGRRDQM